MNKTKKIFIMLIMIYAVCTTFITAFAVNATNPDGKGTVTGEGTVENPYQLVLGEALIDIYYGDYEEATKAGDGAIRFEFTSGKYNAASYIVENNVDKGRLRFKLQGSTEDYLKVTPQQGLNYLQAGAVCYLPDHIESNASDGNGDKTPQEGDVASGVLGEFIVTDSKESGELELQIPFYSIESLETINATPVDGKGGAKEVERSTTLGNGYLIDGSSLLTNVSTYGTAYIFCKSNLDYNEAYKLGSQQIDNIDNIRINYKGEGRAKYINNSDISQVEFVTTMGYFVTNPNDDIDGVVTRYREESKGKYALSGPVRVVYSFNGTNSDLHEAKPTESSPIGNLLSQLLSSLIDKLVKITKLGGNGEYYVTIDSLVFNEYPNTIVDFWGETNFFSGKSKPMINFWFNVFKAWAIAIYIFLLIYIGIKTMIVAGTSEQKKVKGMFEGWLIGVLMMFCFPFLFKYMIEINDMVVDIIRTNSKYSVYAYYTFENMYTKWGQEDGEDSTTSVVDRLRKAAEQLEQEIEDLDKNIGGFNEVYNELTNKQEEAEENRKNGEDGIEENKQIIEDTLNERNWKLIKNESGTEVSIEEIEAYLNNMIYTYYDTNREKLIEEEDITGTIYTDIREYSKNFSYQNEENEIVGDVSLLINEMGKMISDYHANDILIGIYQKDIENLENERQDAEDELADVEYALAKAESNQADIIGEMRVRVDNGGKFIYVVILAIMIFEVIVLLILYYKRLFMIAILIVIFPLITVAYVYERTKGNAKIVKTWLEEYTTNVFIQTIHAILYVTLVEVGYAVYIDNHDNVIVFIIAVTSLITAEPILKHILGLNGKSTISDLGKHGATMGKAIGAATALTATVAKTPQDLKNIDKKAAQNDKKTTKNRERDDKRLETLRKVNDNRINKSSRLSASQKQARLATWKNVHNTTDKAKEFTRKKIDTIKRYKKKADKLGRIAANTTAAFTTVAGGVAAGGDFTDFKNTADIANLITGTGQKVHGSDDVKVDNKVGNVSAENTNEPNSYVPRFSGSSYDDYNYGNSNNGNYAYNGNNTRGIGGYGYNGSVEENNNNTNSTPTNNTMPIGTPEINKPEMKPNVRSLYVNRLNEEKAHSIKVDKNYKDYEEEKRS